MRHYRVDKMRNVEVTDIKRKGKTEFNKQDKAKYNKQFFRMYGGELETVTLLCKNDMANVIIDQFGSDIRRRSIDNDYFSVNIDVAVSKQFLSWVIALGGDIVIEGPENVKDKMRELLSHNFIK